MPLSIWTEELSAVESLLKTSLRSLLLSCPWPGSRARAPVRKKKKWNTMYWLLHLWDIIYFFISPCLPWFLLSHKLCVVPCSLFRTKKSPGGSISRDCMCVPPFAWKCSREGDSVSWPQTWCRMQILRSLIQTLGALPKRIGVKKKKIGFLPGDKDCELWKQ